MPHAMSVQVPQSVTDGDVIKPQLALVSGASEGVVEATPAVAAGHPRIADHHADHLVGSAIDVSLAGANGVHSALTGDDLPATLQDKRGHTPALVFPLRDIRGHNTWQMRPDNPVEGSGKYLQETGSETMIIVPVGMKDRIATASKILVTEGTKQTIAASQCASEDILVLGIVGCWGWARNGVGNGDLDALVDGKSVVIALDADVTKNINVWTAGTTLRQHLLSVGAREVLWIPAATGSKAGMDDYLAERPIGLRTAALSRLVAQATSVVPKKPLKANNTKFGKSTLRSFWDEGVMSMIPTISAADLKHLDGRVEPVEPTVHAAVRIVETLVVCDDLNKGRGQSVTHNLEVAIGRLGTPERYEGRIEGVADADLEDVRAWMEQIDDGRGTHVERLPGRDIPGAIAAAIRAGGARKTIKHYQRLGLAMTPLGPVYLHGGGGITAVGNTTETAAHLEGRLAEIVLPDPAEITAAEAKSIWDRAIKVVDAFNDPTAWYVLVGAIAFAATGAPPESACFLVADPGVGKTTAGQIAFSHLAPFFVNSSMASMNGTGHSVGASGIGAHNSALFVDDARPRGTRRATEQEQDGLEQVIRISYDGPTAARARMGQATKGGDWKTRTPDQSAFLVCITGEALPDVTTLQSTVERLLSVRITQGDLINDKDELARVEKLGYDGVLQQAYALYLQDMLGNIEKERVARQAPMSASIRVSSEMHTERRLEVAAWIREQAPDLTDRQSKVPACYIVGWELYVNAALRYGAITAERAKELADDGRNRILIAAKRHAREVMGINTSKQEVMLDDLRTAVAAGLAHFGRESDRPGSVCLGGKVITDGVDCIAIFPSIAMTLTNSASRDVVHSALRKVARHSEGSITRVVSVNGHSSRAICIPEDVWNGVAPAVPADVATAEAEPLDVPLVSPAVTITPLTPADAHAAKLAALIDSLPVAWTTRTTPSMEDSEF